MKIRLVHAGVAALVIFSASAGAHRPFSPAPHNPVKPSPRLSPLEMLGERLFNDTDLSEPKGQSCATCHTRAAAFSDPNHHFATSRGANRRFFGNRNAPTAMYAAFSPPFHFDDAEGIYIGGQFLDGRAASLEEQAKGPFLNPIEMANSSKEEVVAKVRQANYTAEFRAVFGANAFDQTETAYNYIADAIAAFERTSVFSPFSSKYDAYLAGRTKLSEREARGLELFEREDKGNCAACHGNRPLEDDTPPLFTDFSYDNLGVPKNPRNLFYWMPARFNPDGRHFVDRGLGSALGALTEEGKFKVPTLRNIALTAPYMHNGYFNSLRAVVDFYNSRDVKRKCRIPALDDATATRLRCWPVAEVVENVNSVELGNLGLSEDEVDDIVAFLNTLTDGWQPEQAQNRHHPHASRR